MPTIEKTSLDENDYKKELSNVVSETRAVNVQVAGLDKVQFLSNEIAKLPDEKRVVISSAGDIDSSALEKGRKMASDISTGAINAAANVSSLKQEVKTVPVENLSAKFKIFFSTVIEPFSSVDKGLKHLAGGITSLLTTSALIMGAVKVVITLGKEAWDVLTVSAEEYATKTRLASEAAQEQLRKTQEQDQAAQGYMDRLHEIASAENLSNSSKQETAQLLQLLQSQYGDLGAEIDETTGKCKNLLEVEDRLNKARGERLSRDSAKVADTKMDEAKAAYMKTKGQDWGTTEWGAAEGFEQMKKSMSVDQMIKYMEALSKKGTRQYEIEGYAAVAAKLKESSAAGKKAAYQAHTGYDSKEAVDKALVQKSREATQSKQRLATSEEQFKIRKADDEMNRLQDPNAKIANRQALIDEERSRQQKEAPEEKIEALRKKVADKSDVSANGVLARLEAEKQLNQLLEIRQKSNEKIYGWEQQIAQIKREQGEASRKEAGQSKSDQNVVKSGADGKKTPEKEKDAARKKQDAQNTLNLQNSMRDQGKSLLYGTMEQAGMGPEAAYAKALEEAEKTKGAKLTKEEIERTKQLTDMSLNLSESTPVHLGDLGIRSNDLTARGGFASGAVMPERDEVNRAIRSNTQFMADALKGIQTWLDKLDNSIKEGNRN